MKKCIRNILLWALISVGLAICVWVDTTAHNRVGKPDNHAIQPVPMRSSAFPLPEFKPRVQAILTQ